MKGFRRSTAIACLILLVILTRGYWNATRPPVIRKADIVVDNWPKGAPPVTILLVSDIHLAAPDMTAARASGIIRELNALKPDIVAIAGDLVSDKRVATRFYSTREIVDVIAQFRARLGVVATMGNHDHWHDERGFPVLLRKAGVTLLSNQAEKLGPVVIGGVDDDFTGHADLKKTWAAMDALEGPRVVLTHSPDIVPALPSRVAVVLAGHTHCGQLAFPVVGPLAVPSRYGKRFLCGRMDYNDQPVIVGAGLGTSVIWLRYGAPPDVWLITLKGARS